MSTKEKEKQNKYERSKIYALRSPQTDQIYIGSTTQKLSYRMAGHRREKLNANPKKYCTSSILLDFDDCYIELLEEYKCYNKEQQRKREGEWVRINRAICVNKKLPGREFKEYLKEYSQLPETKEKAKLRQREYYDKHKEKITAKRNANREEINRAARERYNDRILKDPNYVEKRREQRAMVYQASKIVVSSDSE
jgi:hypothetical protein